MSPRRTADAAPRVATELRRLSITLGGRFRDARLARGWTVRQLAVRAGLSPDMIYRVEAGAACSTATIVRLADALDRRVDVQVSDTRRRVAKPTLSADLVHSAMGEVEAAHLRALGFAVGIDEPYQHYQFAGRADVAAWHLDRRAFLHIENRTRFPDLQDMAGVYNAKRAYLARSIGNRLGVRRWDSETHVLAGVWSSEVVHALRLRTESFRALCPDAISRVDAWWAGDPPARGRTSTLIVLDPTATGRARPYGSLEDALASRPRHRSYADLAAVLGSAA